MTPWVTAEYVLYRLDRAGETLMALPSRGCFPSGYRSAMPDYLQLPDEDAESSHRLNPLLSATNTDRPRPPVPGRQDVTEMDQVYLEWLPLLPSATEVERQTRRIVQLRTLVWPGSERKDPHVWSWRALGEMFGIDGKTVSARHALAVDRLVSRVNRHLRAPCGATLARIKAFQQAAESSRQSAVDAIANVATRPKPAPCADTLERLTRANRQAAEWKAAPSRAKETHEVE